MAVVAKLDYQYHNKLFLVLAKESKIRKGMYTQGWLHVPGCQRCLQVNAVHAQLKNKVPQHYKGFHASIFHALETVYLHVR
jgi:hypothetical protein